MLANPANFNLLLRFCNLRLYSLREFISLRTKEALAKRKQDGHTLGRPKGKAEKVKLDANEAEILGYLEKQVSKRAIAKILGCAPSTLYEWLERQGLNTYKRAGGRLKGRLALPLDNRMPGHS
jgi:DNA invertase Pin-like site-specific DNA recombinase